MRKKERNEDGTKKRKQSTISDRMDTFEDDFIWQLKMGEDVTSANGLDYCSYCDVHISINMNSLRRHYTCSSHMNNYTISNLLPFFKKNGVDWLLGQKKFYCEECELVLDTRSKIVLQHINEHGKTARIITTGGEEDFSGLRSSVKFFKLKLWKVDLKSTNAGLNKQLLKYKRLERPFVLREDAPLSSFIACLKIGVFSEGDLTLLNKASSFLEEKGDYVDRSETINGSKMSAFGMHWGIRDTGW